ncbi:MAG: ABC transporter ATP-binding protein [Sebaldella sp.]|nr:ABC transporter ATP-binding protein [Sebaldella sp.]
MSNQSKSGFGRGSRNNIILSSEKLSGEEVRANLKRILGLLLPYKFNVIMLTLFILINTISSVIGPVFIGKIIDEAIVPKDMQLLVKLLAMLAGIYFIGVLASWLQMYIVAFISQSAIKDLRNRLFDKLTRLSPRFFDTHTSGELMSRLTNDIDQIGNTLSQSLTQVISGTLTLVGILVTMLVLNFYLTVLTVITVPISLLAIRKITKKSQNYFLIQQKNLGELNGLIEESITAQATVKAHLREETMIGKFSVTNKKLRDVGRIAQMLSGMILPLMTLINNLSYVLIAIFGGILSLMGFVSIGLIGTFISYSRQFGQPINQLSSQMNQLQVAIASSSRVFEILNTEVEITDEKDARELTDEINEITFENVTFSYVEDKEVLKDISFKVKKGETIALVGPTGVGKTTIINLLMRFYDIKNGEIKVNNENIKDFKLSSLRKKIGIVLQETVLFVGSVKDNIGFGNLDADDNEIKEAAFKANADDFISLLKEEYDTELRDDGENLSSGQRQLLSIARTILSDPDVLILDEATSNVDTRTEKKIQEAMKRLMFGRINIVIAHRLSTIREANKILVLKDGGIAESGSHRELLEKKGEYYNIYNSQFAGENGVL